ncbi:bifunctional UDP-N-acetylglucosamine diphosphorylase/glucosamine-1-phosphate N-acetyltransferase GlmU [Amaricoccus macauensis]|uniref:bifunctional UDP-N-acetylglucosamine diphosphorylase/glucosamine-1-phosphate N-acetyltransferase GlmU n=1 Tax=Amaricoccus macauensis TaxID=57001 RepID=UPI003C7B8A88
MSIAVVILAAGQGTRMKSDLPKVLHGLAGAPLLAHVMATAQEIESERLVVVTGHGAEAVEAEAATRDEEARFVRQEEQLGTGHAVLQAAPELADFSGDVAILYGDTPLIRPETLEAMQKAREEGASVVVLGFETACPTGYGRLIRDEDGSLLKIVEEKDATPAEREVSLCNSGVILADSALLFELLSEVRNDNAKGEYYLTDVIGLARGRGLTAGIITCPESETLGVNSRTDLAAAEAAFQARARSEAMENGVTLSDPATTWFALDTVIGRDVQIGPSVFFGPGVTVESGATILAFCHLEGCHVSRGARVGPYARLRPGAELAEDTHIGNFVEIKNAIVDEGAKVNHLSYIGDAHVGTATNIGAGTITCNYDGVFKHHTEIGARVFVGSNSALIAPVTIGNDAMIAAGSIITESVPEGALAVARSRQATKPGLGRRLMDKLRAAKKKKQEAV